MQQADTLVRHILHLQFTFCWPDTTMHRAHRRNLPIITEK